MKVLMVPNNTKNNCYGLRNALPAEFLLKRGYEVRMINEFKGYYNPILKTQAIDPSDIDWCDTVVFNRHYDVETATIANLMLYARANGKKVIYETDDLLTGVDPSNPAYEKLEPHVHQVAMMANMADICTTTGPALKEELRKFNRRVEIAPNCVDPEQWTKRKGKNKKVRVGWAGGSSHAADLLMIIDAIKDLQKEIDFEFVIFGLVDGEWNSYIEKLRKRHKEQVEGKSKEWKKALDKNSFYKNMKLETLMESVSPAKWFSTMDELGKKMEGLKWEHHPFVPLKDYNKKLSDLNFDIGICPLEDTRFNRCKSAIKFYEYAMVNTMTLASKVSPYQEEVNCTVKNRYVKWKNKLKQLIQDQEIREFLSQEQREWVLKNRDIRSNIHLWERIYSKLTIN